MKIAIFTDIFLEVAGGIPSSIKAECELLEKNGHEVYVFCPGFNNLGDEKVKLVPTNKLLKPNGAPLSKRPSVVYKYILETYPEVKNFDVVHVHYEMGVSLAGILIAKKYKIPLVQTLHGREDSAAQTNLPLGLKTAGAGFLNLLHSRTFKHSLKVRKGDAEFISTRARAKMFEIMVNQANLAGVVLTPSAHFKQKLEKAGVKKPIFVVPNQMTHEFLEKKPKVKEFNGKEPLKIVFSSRVSKEKRLFALLKALSKLPKKDKFRLEVFGDGNELKKCQRFARKKYLNVKFYGQTPRERILKALDEAHLAATVSYNFDTQGMTILEAEKRGTPSLICDPELKEGLEERGLFITKAPDAEGILEVLEAIFREPKLVKEKSEAILKSCPKGKTGRKATKTLTFLEICDKIGVSA